MADGPLRIERAGGVAWCTFERPPLNLLDLEAIAALQGAFVALAADSTVRVAVIAGAGRAFTAGMNVRVLRDLDPESARGLITSLRDAIEAVHAAPFPVIAAVRGACLGAGFELALACDMRVAAEDALFGLPEVRVGVPSVIHAALLPALVGPGRAAEILLLGQLVRAPDALAWGLVNRVVPTHRLEDGVRELVAGIIACAPSAIRLQKELMIRWRSDDVARAVTAGIDAFARAYATGEPREAATAFLEKRAPIFGRRSS